MLSCGIRRFSLLLMALMVAGCHPGKSSMKVQKSAAIVTLEVIQPFTQDIHLATIKIHKINDCKIKGSCRIIPLNQELLANFVFTHQSTVENKNFKALRNHLPGVQPESVIEAYIITERQKHGVLRTNVYEYKLLR